MKGRQKTPDRALLCLKGYEMKTYLSMTLLILTVPSVWASENIFETALKLEQEAQEKINAIKANATDAPSDKMTADISNVRKDADWKINSLFRRRAAHELRRVNKRLDEIKTKITKVLDGSGAKVSESIIGARLLGKYAQEMKAKKLPPDIEQRCENIWNGNISAAANKAWKSGAEDILLEAQSANSAVNFWAAKFGKDVEDVVVSLNKISETRFSDVKLPNGSNAKMSGTINVRSLFQWWPEKTDSKEANQIDINVNFGQISSNLGEAETTRAKMVSAMTDAFIYLKDIGKEIPKAKEEIADKRAEEYWQAYRDWKKKMSSADSEIDS